MYAQKFTKYATIKKIFNLIFNETKEIIHFNGKKNLVSNKI